MAVLSNDGDYLRHSSFNGVIVSTCTFCHLVVAAAAELDNVEIAERAHDCPEKRKGRETAAA